MYCFGRSSGSPTFVEDQTKTTIWLDFIVCYFICNQCDLFPRREKSADSASVEQFIARKADLLFAHSWKSSKPAEEEWPEETEGTAVLPHILGKPPLFSLQFIFCLLQLFLLKKYVFVVHRAICCHATSGAVFGRGLWWKTGPILQGCGARGRSYRADQLHPGLWVLYYSPLCGRRAGEGHGGPGAHSKTALTGTVLPADLLERAN